MDIQKQEMREAVELPLTHFELYKQIGIDPPRGVLMYGPPGCGKTMLAKAVAHHTTASFIRVVGSEFVQKYLGEGPRMVRDVFRLAKENAPAIIFIDEIDAIATKRFDAQTGGIYSLPNSFVARVLLFVLLFLLNGVDLAVVQESDSHENVNAFTEKKGLKIFHQNVRGLFTNFNLIQNLFSTCKKIDILTVSETHINGFNDNNDLYQIDGYNFIQRNRKQGKGGGVGIYLRDNLNGNGDSTLKETQWKVFGLR